MAKSKQSRQPKQPRNLRSPVSEIDERLLFLVQELNADSLSTTVDRLSNLEAAIMDGDQINDTEALEGLADTLNFLCRLHAALTNEEWTQRQPPRGTQ